MDDLVVWQENREELRRTRDAVSQFLGDRLQLALKPAIINASSRGMTYLGYRIFPGRMRLARRSRDRFRQKLAAYYRTYTDGLWDEPALARHVEPLLAFVKRAESRSFRQRVLEEIGLCPWARTA